MLTFLVNCLYLILLLFAKLLLLSVHSDNRQRLAAEEENAKLILSGYHYKISTQIDNDA